MHNDVIHQMYVYFICIMICFIMCMSLADISYHILFRTSLPKFLLRNRCCDDSYSMGERKKFVDYKLKHTVDCLCRVTFLTIYPFAYW